jgi:hypothetical protein
MLEQGKNPGWVDLPPKNSFDSVVQKLPFGE